MTVCSVTKEDIEMMEVLIRKNPPNKKDMEGILRGWKEKLKQSQDKRTALTGDPKAILFSHKRTPEEVECFMSNWPKSDRAEITNEKFNGVAFNCSDVGGGVVIVLLHEGEQIHVLISNSDQSGAATMMRVSLEVDNAEIKVISVGGESQTARLISKLPIAAQKVIAPWYNLLL